MEYELCFNKIEMCYNVRNNNNTKLPYINNPPMIPTNHNHHSSPTYTSIKHLTATTSRKQLRNEMLNHRTILTTTITIFINTTTNKQPTISTPKLQPHTPVKTN